MLSKRDGGNRRGRQPTNASRVRTASGSTSFDESERKHERQTGSERSLDAMWTMETGHPHTQQAAI
jgi:hypothetical protein